MSRELSPNPISNKVAARVAVYAMLSVQAYHKEKGSKRLSFPVERLGWIQTDAEGSRIDPADNISTKSHRFSGLAYDIYEREGTNEVVFAFRGTDSANDYLYANFAVPPFNICVFHA